MTYRLSRRARLDILALWSYIAEQNPVAADGVVDRLTSQFQLLGDHPYAGRAREDLRHGYRTLAAGQYVIFYKVSQSFVSIVRVLHGRRDVGSTIR